MKSMIKFISNQEAHVADEDFDENVLYARIFFGDGDYETFCIDITDWSKEYYIKQWKHAVRYSIKNRDISLLFKDFRISTPYNVMRSFVYILIPEEMADTEKWSDQNSEDSIQPQDFYITERIIYATTELSTLCSEKILNIIKDCDDVYKPIYYVNPNRLDWFYPYMRDNTSLQNIWHKKISKKHLESILRL